MKNQSFSPSSPRSEYSARPLLSPSSRACRKTESLVSRSPSNRKPALTASLAEPQRPVTTCRAMKFSASTAPVHLPQGE